MKNTLTSNLREEIANIVKRLDTNRKGLTTKEVEAELEKVYPDEMATNAGYKAFSNIRVRRDLVPIPGVRMGKVKGKGIIFYYDRLTAPKSDCVEGIQRLMGDCEEFITGLKKDEIFKIDISKIDKEELDAYITMLDWVDSTKALFTDIKERVSK